VISVRLSTAPASSLLGCTIQATSTLIMASQTAIELDVVDHRATQSALQNPLTSLQQTRKASSASVLLSTAPAEPSAILLKGRSIIVTLQLAGINFITSFVGGVLTIGLPTIAAELSLERALLIWPSSAFYLASGATLLLAGAFADAIGARTVNLAGCLFLSIFMLANALAQTGIQLIVFRALQGMASSLVVPTAIAIISTSIETGQRRNLAFATLGLAMPLGFSAGLVLGGVFVSGPGWRVGYYIAAAVSLLFFFIGIWSLPKGIKQHEGKPLRTRITKEIDWVGAGMASTSLALFSYVLACVPTP
jgi:MFS family permease